MPFSLPKTKNSNGQTLIGVIVALTVFSILSQAIFTVVVATYNFVSFNRARITAKHLGQEKMELLRNLSYENVGTVGGIPAGPIPQTENITENNLGYTIKTTIVYIDDPFDDTAPDDLLPTDYKRVRVEVSWKGLASSRTNPVTLLTDIAPKGIETTAGGGTLSIVVFDSNTNPVPQADVAISAPSLSPPIDLTLKTGSNGRVLLPGAPACDSCYKIVISKSGYSSERTYSTSEVANPTKPDQSVFVGKLTEIDFAIDKTANLDITTKTDRTDGFSTLANANFSIRGDKTIGTDTSSQPVYKYSQTLTTDASGNLTLPDFEWDSYHITRAAASSYDISGTNPQTPLAVSAGVPTSLTISFSPHSSNSLLLSFVDSSLSPIASVSATLTQGSYDKTVVGGSPENPDVGQAFFSALVNQDYNLTATVSGYLNYSTTVTVSGQTQEQVIMTHQ